MGRRAWLLFAAMCVIWGVPYLLIRVAVRDVTPGTLVCLRTGLGGLVLLPFALRQGGFGLVARAWRPLVAFAALELAGPWLLLGEAEQHLSSSLTGLLVAAVPLAGLVVAKIMRADDRHGGPVRYAGLLLGLAGVVVLLGVDLGSVSVGALVEVGFVVLGYAIAPAILARYLSHLPTFPVICSALLLVAIAYLPYALVRLPESLSAESAWSIVGLALVCTALAFVLFFALVDEVGPSRATVFTYVNPAVALLLGVVLLDEQFTVGIAIGFPLILAGSVLATRRAPSTTAAVAESVDADVAAGRGESGGDESVVAVER